MLDERLRRMKDQVLRPVAERAGALHPVTITGIGFLLGVAAAAAAAAGAFGPALALWLANRFCDGLDGAVARAHGKQSDWGGYVDLVADLVVYALVPIALAVGRPDAWAPLAWMLGAFYVNLGSWTLLSALSGRRGSVTSVPMPAGLIEGAETVVLYSAFLMLPSWLPQLFGLTAALVLATALQRVSWASRSLPG